MYSDLKQKIKESFRSSLGSQVDELFTINTNIFLNYTDALKWGMENLENVDEQQLAQKIECWVRDDVGA